jgi:IMP dehydrogenase
MNQVFPLGLSYDDVLLVPQYSRIISRSNIDLSTQITPHIKLAIPLISSNMGTVTDSHFAITIGKLGGLGVIPRFISAEAEANMISKVKKENLISAASIGCKKDEVAIRSEILVKAGADIFFIDVAHGHMEQVIETTSFLKSKYGKVVDIVAGNVATGEGAKALYDAGADCVKVGIGPGSICITRQETGCGVPQITAVLNVAKIAQRLKKTLICDGGMKNSGDVVKALAAGASAIMSGHLFAGAKESPGKIFKSGKNMLKEYNGSTSLVEKLKHVKNVGSKKLSFNYLFQIEGVASYVPYKGPLEEILIPMLGNIRSGFSYCGANNISQLHKKAKFIRVSPVGFKENGAHDVILAK